MQTTTPSRRIAAAGAVPAKAKGDVMGVGSINKENSMGANDVSTVSSGVLFTPSRKAGGAVLSGPQRVLVPTKTPTAKPATPKVKNHFMATTVAYRNGCYPTPQRESECKEDTSVTAPDTSTTATTPGRAHAVPTTLKPASSSPAHAPRMTPKQSPPTRLTSSAVKPAVPTQRAAPTSASSQIASITTAGRRAPGPLSTGLSDTVNSDDSSKGPGGDRQAPSFAPPPPLSQGPAAKARQAASLSSNSRAASSSSKSSLMRPHSTHASRGQTKPSLLKNAHIKQPQALRHSCSFGSELSSVLNDGLSIGSIGGMELGLGGMDDIQGTLDHSLSLSVSVSTEQEDRAETRRQPKGDKTASSGSNIANKLSRVVGEAASGGGAVATRHRKPASVRHAFSELDEAGRAGGSSQLGAPLPVSSPLAAGPVAMGGASLFINSNSNVLAPFAVPRFASMDRQGSGSSMQSAQSMSNIFPGAEDMSPRSVDSMGPWRAGSHSPGPSSQGIMTGSTASMSADLNQGFLHDTSLASLPSGVARSPRHSVSPTEGQYQSQYQKGSAADGTASGPEQLSAILKTSTSVLTTDAASLLDRAALLEGSLDLQSSQALSQHSHIFRQGSLDSQSYHSYAPGSGRQSPQSPTLSDPDTMGSSLPDSSLSLTLPYNRSASGRYEDDSYLYTGELVGGEKREEERPLVGCGIPVLEEIPAVGPEGEVEDSQLEGEAKDNDPSSSVCSLELSHWRLHSNNDSMDSAVSLSSLRDAATIGPNRAHVRRIAKQRLEARDPVARILIEEGPAVLDPDALFVPVVPDYGGGI